MSDNKPRDNAKNMSQDFRLQNLLSLLETEINDYASHLTLQIERLADIGIALSGEHDQDKLLEMIMDEARRFTMADAGTLYMFKKDEKGEEKLFFEILQNETLGVRMGGTTGEKIELPPVELRKSNVSAYAAITGKSVNIPDVYESDLFDFTGPRKYDEQTGYRSKSMLVVPMRDHEDVNIGVLQLLNARDPKSGAVIPFSKDFESLTMSLASQAAVAISNARLITGMEELIDSIVTVMATAIDERSPYTAGHIKRVAELGVALCEKINDQKTGVFSFINFNDDQLKEMRIAGWMHDIGKITTPVHIVDKATKLQTLFDRVEMLNTRFMTIETTERNVWLEKKLEMYKKGTPAKKIAEEEKMTEERIGRIQDDLKFLVSANSGGEFMDDERMERVITIAQKTFSFNGTDKHYLTDDELQNLLIRKGTLLDSERKIMQDHAAITIRMLDKIPFTKKLKNVPRYAGGHHEAIDGSGYPKGLKGDEIPLEARILALVDFFEALTASDRPYKKAMPIDKVMMILKSEVEKKKLDKDLFELFEREGFHKLYATASPGNGDAKHEGNGKKTGAKKSGQSDAGKTA